jgi:hypothetical protein
LFAGPGESSQEDVFPVLAQCFEHWRTRVLISSSVKRSVALRPSRSPIRPNIRAPMGRARNPAKIVKKEEATEPPAALGKNSLLLIALSAQKNSTTDVSSADGLPVCYPMP